MDKYCINNILIDVKFSWKKFFKDNIIIFTEIINIIDDIKQNTDEKKQRAGLEEVAQHIREDWKNNTDIRNKKKIIESDKIKHIQGKKIICTTHPFQHDFTKISKKIIFKTKNIFLKLSFF